MLLSTTTTVTDSTGATGSLTTTCTIGELFTLGETEPTAANTGLNVLGLTTADIPASKIVNGDLTVNDAWVTANGSSPTRWWVKGFLNFTASTPVKFYNSILEARTFTGTAPREAVVRARNGSAPVTATISFENCMLKVVQPDVGISTAAGERLGSFYRCDISGGSDLLDYWASSVPNVQGCYLHDYSFWANDPKHTNDSQHPGWCHPDYIQNSGSDGGTVFGNTFDIRAAVGQGDVATLTAGGFPNRNYGCGVMLTPGSGHITNIVIRKNWFRGGEVHVCMPRQTGTYDDSNSWEVSENRHAPDVHGYGPYSSQYSKQFIRWGMTEGPLPASVWGNKWMDGTPMPAVSTLGTGNTGQYMVVLNSVTQ
jgi:hypothetical protein